MEGIRAVRLTHAGRLYPKRAESIPYPGTFALLSESVQQEARVRAMISTRARVPRRPRSETSRGVERRERSKKGLSLGPPNRGLGVWEFRITL